MKVFLLDKYQIKKDAGLRSLSKLALNSFYGKFGQRTNMKKNKFIDNIGDLYNILCDRSKILVDFHIMNSQMMELELKHSEDFTPTNTNTNLLIAAFCTSWARLKL